MTANLEMIKVQLKVATNTLHCITRALEFDLEPPTESQVEEIKTISSNIDKYKSTIPKTPLGYEYKRFLNKLQKDLNNRVDN